MKRFAKCVGLGLISLAMFAGVGSTASAASPKARPAASQQLSPKAEYELALKNYRKALDNLAMARTSQSIYHNGRAAGVWQGSRSNQAAGVFVGALNDLSETTAINEVEITRRRLHVATVRLQQAEGYAPAR